MEETEGTVDDVVACMTKTRANTLPMRACLEACLEEGPYRDIETRLGSEAVMDMSTQTPHVLIDLLVRAGGINRRVVEEGSGSERHSCVRGDASEDQPTDYTLQTTLAGREALEAFEPSRLISEFFSKEPYEFQEVACRILALCEDGAALSRIDQEIGAGTLTSAGKTVYPEYFVSKLEAAGGLAWDGVWRTTEAGKLFLQTRATD